MPLAAHAEHLKRVNTHPLAAFLNSFGCAFIAWSVLAWGSNVVSWITMHIGSVHPLLSWEKIAVQVERNWSWRLVLLVVIALFLFYLVVFVLGTVFYTQFKRENSIRRLLGTWLQWTGLAWTAGFLLSGIFPNSEMNAFYLWIGGAPPLRAGIAFGALALACMASKPLIYAFLRNSGSLSAIRTPEKAALFLLKYTALPLLALLWLSFMFWKGDLGDSFALMVLVQLVMLLSMLLWLFIRRPTTTKYKIYVPPAFHRFQTKLMVLAAVFLLSLVLPLLGLIA